MVIANFKLNWWRIKKDNKHTQKLDVNMMKSNNRSTSYKQFITQNINTVQEAETNEKWRRTVELCKRSVQANFGNVKSNQRKTYDNPEIIVL